MKLLEKIKTLFVRSRTHKVETIIISEKQCPHCASRGMFVFNSASQTKIKNGKSNEKNN